MSTSSFQRSFYSFRLTSFVSIEWEKYLAYYLVCVVFSSSLNGHESRALDRRNAQQQKKRSKRENWLNQSENDGDEFYCATFNLTHRVENNTWNECSLIAYRTRIKQANKQMYKSKSQRKKEKERETERGRAKKVKWSYVTICCNSIITIWHGSSHWIHYYKT